MNEEFEKWAAECGYNIADFKSVAWAAWQASRKQALEEASAIAEGKMIHAGTVGRMLQAQEIAVAIRALQQQ